jgi:hypothetical protein
MDYILEPPNTKDTNNDSLLVLCVDVSGSMCVTSQVPKLQSEWKKIQDKKKVVQSTTATEGLEPGINTSNQLLPGETAGAMYLSRLVSSHISITNND